MTSILSFFNTSEDNRLAQLNQKLIRREAKMGGKLFGPIPKGHQRQFFCIDQHTWVWHESWSDQKGQHAVTTRYELRPNGVFKVQNNSSYQSLTDNEARNLRRAIRLYVQRVVADYNQLVSAA